MGMYEYIEDLKKSARSISRGESDLQGLVEFMEQLLRLWQYYINALQLAGEDRSIQRVEEAGILRRTLLGSVNLVNDALKSNTTIARLNEGDGIVVQSILRDLLKLRVSHCSVLGSRNESVPRSDTRFDSDELRTWYGIVAIFTNSWIKDIKIDLEEMVAELQLFTEKLKEATASIQLAGRRKRAAA